VFARDPRHLLPLNFFRLAAVIPLLSQLLWPALAQSQAIQLARISTPESFRQTARKAGLIFDGTVVAIARESGNGRVPLAYRISFQVKQGIRGVRSGSAVTIREWAGLWRGTDTHEPRYRVGERSLLFFYLPRAGGLTSPVGGHGKLAVDLAGMVIVPAEWSSHEPFDKHNGATSAATRSGATRAIAPPAMAPPSRRIPVRVLAEQIRLAEAD